MIMTEKIMTGTIISRHIPFLLLCIICLSNCTSGAKVDRGELILIESSSKSGGEANLAVDRNGTAYLSWVEYANDSTDVLQFAFLETDSWSSDQVIATGKNWFVNWADFPSMIVHHENAQLMAAHWLQKSAEGTYDYDVRISISQNAGKDWSQSFIPHTDGISAEHGFVSMLSIPNQHFFATWLDGRNTKVDSSDVGNHDHNHGGGAMTLRAATFDQEGNINNEVELDSRVCDCCQTAATKTNSGIVVAYRDRSENEIRDISIVRQTGYGWSKPKVISNDNWEIAGCPVNGPAIDAIGNQVAIAWFTAADNKPKVQIIFSEDAGVTFSEPIRIDNGRPIGRVDLIMLSESTALVSWIEQNEEVTELLFREISTNGSSSPVRNITKVADSRSSGFPRMIRSKDQIIFAWTGIDAERTRVMTGYLNIEE